MSSATVCNDITNSYTEQYQFYDKRYYQTQIDYFYEISDCYSPETLAKALDIPEKSVLDAMQKLIIPADWIYRIFFKVMEMLEELIDKTKMFPEEDLSIRYRYFMENSEKNLIDRFKIFAKDSFFAEDHNGVTEEEFLDSFKLQREVMESIEKIMH